jgi:hypothetical protein
MAGGVGACSEQERWGGLPGAHGGDWGRRQEESQAERGCEGSSVEVEIEIEVEVERSCLEMMCMRESSMAAPAKPHYTVTSGSLRYHCFGCARKQFEVTLGNLLQYYRMLVFGNCLNHVVAVSRFEVVWRRGSAAPTA